MRNITNKEKLKNVENKKNYLDTFMKKFKLYNIDPLYIHLFETNKKLWNIEDNIRYKEYLKQFDDEFIELSRSVYMTNDKRCDIKKEINYKFNSSIIEEKEYNYYT